MITKMDKKDMQNMIAKRAAKELENSKYVNVGIGIPTLAANYVESEDVFLHTENGLLGVGPEPATGEADPNLVNAGKLSVTEENGASFFSSSQSFGMIRGGHVDTVVLGVLQVDAQGVIANWAVPGKNIIGVGGAMDLLEGAEKVIVTMTHTTRNGEAKILQELTYPRSSLRSVNMIITELAVFEVRDKKLYLTELMGETTTLEDVKEHTEAEFVVDLKD